MSHPEQSAFRKSKLAHAPRLTPFINRLVLVTDAESAASVSALSNVPSDTQAAHITELARLISGKIFQPEMQRPLGISVHLTTASYRDYELQLQSAQLLGNALSRAGHSRLKLTLLHRSSPALWLNTIVSAAEDTTQEYEAAAQDIGHIAVVFPSDATPETADLDAAPPGGEVFALKAVDETAGATPVMYWERYTPR